MPLQKGLQGIHMDTMDGMTEREEQACLRLTRAVAEAATEFVLATGRRPWITLVHHPRLEGEVPDRPTGWVEVGFEEDGAEGMSRA